MILRGKREGLTGRPGSKIGTGKLKHKARRVGARDRDKKDGHEGVQKKGRRLNRWKEMPWPSWETSSERVATNKTEKS